MASSKKFQERQRAFLESDEGREYVRGLRQRTPEDAEAVKAILAEGEAKDKQSSERRFDRRWRKIADWLGRALRRLRG